MGCSFLDLLITILIRLDHDELRGMAEKMQASYGTGKFLDGMQSFGFEGALDFNDRNLSSIEYVLRNKVGIPISLAMVIIGIATCLV